jgi:hypothetical protein
MSEWSERMRAMLSELIRQESELGRWAQAVANEIAEREPRPGENRPEGRLHGGGGLSVDDIERIVAKHHPHPVNCYPGKPGSGCHEVVLFFALHGKAAYGPGHYTFEEILQLFVRHTEGSCPGFTREAAIITDSWWAPNYERWRETIERIQREQGIHLEIYLIGAGWVTPVPV